MSKYTSTPLTHLIWSQSWWHPSVLLQSTSAVIVRLGVPLLDVQLMMMTSCEQMIWVIVLVEGLLIPGLIRGHHRMGLCGDKSVWFRKLKICRFGRDYWSHLWGRRRGSGLHESATARG